jgi:hypothetical protein
VVAPDDDGSFDDTFGDKFIEGESGLVALPITQPAYASRQTLEMNLLPGQSDPTGERSIFGKELEDGLVGAIDIFWIAGECYPAEGAFASTEQRVNVGWDEAGKIECMCFSCVQSLPTQVVAVVEIVMASGCAPPDKCHSMSLAAILPELTALFGLPSIFTNLVSSLT